jgi:hypothetical protein
MFSSLSFTLAFYTLYFFFSFCMCFFLCVYVSIYRYYSDLSSKNGFRIRHLLRNTQVMQNTTDEHCKSGIEHWLHSYWKFCCFFLLLLPSFFFSPFWSFLYSFLSNTKICSHLFPSFFCLSHFSPFYCSVFHVYFCSCKLLVTSSLYFFLWFLLYVSIPFSRTRELLPGSV